MTDPGITSIPALDAAEVAAEAAYWKGRADQHVIAIDRELDALRPEYAAAIDRHPAGKGLARPDAPLDPRGAIYLRAALEFQEECPGAIPWSAFGADYFDTWCSTSLSWEEGDEPDVPTLCDMDDDGIPSGHICPYVHKGAAK